MYTVDLERLERLLDDEEFVRRVARRYAGPFRVAAATIYMYEHDGGFRVRGLPGRWWVAVRLLDERGEPVYDASLVKLLADPVLRERLVAAGAVAEE